MKKIIILLASAALIASGLSIVPASAAEEAPTIPEVVQIDDPPEDANYLNGQLVASDQGDNTTPADVSTVGDILKVWFSNTAETISVHVQTQAPPPSSAPAYTFFLYANADECLFIEGTVAAPSYQGESNAAIEDGCAGLEEADGEISVAEGPDGTGITTATFPRSYSDSFGDGAVITAPRVEMNNTFGGDATGSLRFPAIDNTKPGLDYVVTTGIEKAKKKTPPGKNNPPGKKKGCKKGKGKKRGCEGKGKKSPKRGKPSARCASFTPGEAGTEAKTVVLSDAATEEKPVEETLTFGESTADVAGDPSLNFLNLQVDSKAKDAGLYALLEFPARNDYDLNLLHTDGSYAARSRAFNTIIETNDQEAGGFALSRTGHGGESTASSEKLVGIKTADCGGWTLELANWLGEGGDLTVKLWLGEAQIDPQEPGAETP